jgi:hypothetical protein
MYIFIQFNLQQEAQIKQRKYKYKKSYDKEVHMCVMSNFGTCLCLFFNTLNKEVAC